MVLNRFEEGTQREKDYLKEGQFLYKHGPLCALGRSKRSHKNIQTHNVATVTITDGLIIDFQVPGLSRLTSTSYTIFNTVI